MMGMTYFQEGEVHGPVELATCMGHDSDASIRADIFWVYYFCSVIVVMQLYTTGEEGGGCEVSLH
jgi:hypothetical protein